MHNIVDAGKVGATSTRRTAFIVLHHYTDALPAHLQPTSHGTIIANIEAAIGTDSFTAEGVFVSGLQCR